MNYYTDVLKKYAVFEGRAGRKEYWMFVLLNLIISMGVSIVAMAIGLKFIKHLYQLALFVPSLAVGVRRLHDTDRSGWWMLLVLIPIIGWIWIIILLAQKSNPAATRFDSPKQVS